MPWRQRVEAAAQVESIHEASIARQHERLSVQPRLRISFYYNNTGAGWEMSNDGPGTARLRGFRAIVNGIPQKPTNFFPNILNSFKLPNRTSVEFVNPQVGNIVASQKAIQILWIPPGPGAQIIITQHNNVVFHVCYCSIYKECWVYSSNSGKLDGQKDDACSEFANDPKSIWWDG
jgi:hypothetical protein